MAPISLDQLYQIVERQDQRIAALANEISKLKNWSDLSDQYLQDMIDSNTGAIDRLRTVINEMHEADVINERIQELEEEEQTPVAQLLLEFIEKNASDEQKEELKCQKNTETV